MKRIILIALVLISFSCHAQFPGLNRNYGGGNIGDITSIAHVQSYSVSSREGQVTGLHFSSDGLNMQISGFESDEINQYSLSVAWDISTSTYVSVKDITTWESIPQDVWVSDDGLTNWVVGTSGDEINEFSMSPAWSASSMTFVQNKSVIATSLGASGIFFKDGNTVFISDNNDDDVDEYSMSTAWDISTLAYVKSGSVFQSSVLTNPSGLFFSPDGTFLYITSDTFLNFFKFSLSSAWDISTLVYVGAFSISADVQQGNGLYINPDFTKLYITDRLGDNIVEYGIN